PAKPSMIAPIGPISPAPGVTATSPATTPDTRPSNEGFPLVIHSPNIQARPAAAVATKVFTTARAAVPLAESAEPALKPNQPTQSSAPPTIVSGSECGGSNSLP